MSRLATGCVSQLIPERKGGKVGFYLARPRKSLKKKRRRGLSRPADEVPGVRIGG